MSTSHTMDERPVEIRSAGLTLHGDLTVPRRASGVVLFAHGSGSSRHSPRNRAVAATLVDGGLATLLLDLLTSTEEAGERAGGMQRFDVDLLAIRLIAAVDWLAFDPATRDLPLGLFGASTGAAAALVAATLRPDRVRAIVSRGGRPDLAGDRLGHVAAPTRLLVGGADATVLDLNSQALAELGCTKELVVVHGATHLFEEPGALERVAQLALDWFVHHLTATTHHRGGRRAQRPHGAAGG